MSHHEESPFGQQLNSNTDLLGAAGSLPVGGPPETSRRVQENISMLEKQIELRRSEHTNKLREVAALTEEVLDLEVKISELRETVDNNEELARVEAAQQQMEEKRQAEIDARIAGESFESAQRVLLRQMHLQVRGELSFNRVAAELQERYIAAMRALNFYDPTLLEQRELQEGVLAEQEHELQALRDLLKAVKEAAADCAYRCLAEEYKAHPLLLRSSIRLPVGECMIKIPSGRIRRIAAALHELRCRYLVQISCHTSSDGVDVHIGGHLNGVRKTSETILRLMEQAEAARVRDSAALRKSTSPRRKLKH